MVKYERVPIIARDGGHLLITLHDGTRLHCESVPMMVDKVVGIVGSDGQPIYNVGLGHTVKIASGPSPAKVRPRKKTRVLRRHK